jgi:uncharacterized coiled-coil DUF342 family protein
MVCVQDRRIKELESEIRRLKAEIRDLTDRHTALAEKYANAMSKVTV